jgi:glycerol kinase
MIEQVLLSIDQGTTSTRALAVDPRGAVVASRSVELTQHYPGDGWVEHDAEEILAGVRHCARAVCGEIAECEIAGLGIANQRETTVLWDRRTGKALYNAIVWQDRRTRAACDRLTRSSRSAAIQDKTGLVIDPYFSATKIAWLLDNVPNARARAEAGELAFGTIDSWLIYRLTGGHAHVTDATNASRTMLYNIASGEWDDEILSWLNIPRSVLPRVLDSAAEFGVTQVEHFGRAIAILGVAGDQQAASIAQACLKPGMVKSTYGTGCFMLMNTGKKMPRSSHRLLGTIASRLGGQVSYALEGSIFMAGGVIDWLKDIGIIGDIGEAGPLAARANPDSRCYLVPGFTGLGAPYWASDARGALVGMTRDTGRAEICAAAIDATCYQTRDLLEAMAADTGIASDILRVDGGMARSDVFLQRLADLTGVEVVRAANVETTALGAAYLAGLKAGVFGELAEVAALWRQDTAFAPKLDVRERNARYEGWQTAIRRTL